MNLINHIKDQAEWSFRTFGPPTGDPSGNLDHIAKELEEIRKAPSDLMEWIDVVTLAIDGALRQGYSPEEIAKALADKLAINKARRWPDWRTVEKGKAIEHVRD